MYINLIYNVMCEVSINDQSVPIVVNENVPAICMRCKSNGLIYTDCPKYAQCAENH
jgi:hypothetical protein